MKNVRKQDLTAALAIAGFYALLFRLGVTCPIKLVTGLSCPGCGMTRAWLSLLRLDLGTAWEYHPLFWLPPIVLALYLFRAKLPRWVAKYGPAAVCAVFCSVYLIRLLSGCAPHVVVWAPREGLLYRLAAALANGF